MSRGPASYFSWKEKLSKMREKWGKKIGKFFERSGDFFLLVWNLGLFIQLLSFFSSVCWRVFDGFDWIFCEVLSQKGIEYVLMTSNMFSTLTALLCLLQWNRLINSLFLSFYFNIFPLIQGILGMKKLI